MGIGIKASGCDFSECNIGNLNDTIKIVVPEGDLDSTVVLSATNDGTPVDADWEIVKGSEHAAITKDTDNKTATLVVSTWSDDKLDITVKASYKTSSNTATVDLKVSRMWHPTQLTQDDFEYLFDACIIMKTDSSSTVRDGIRLAPFGANNGHTKFAKMRALTYLPASKYPPFRYSTSILANTEPSTGYFSSMDLSSFIDTDAEAKYVPLIIPKGCKSITFSGTVVQNSSAQSYTSFNVEDIYRQNSGRSYIDSGWISSATFEKTLDCTNCNEGLSRPVPLRAVCNCKSGSGSQDIDLDQLKSDIKFTLTFNY